jgi:triosephosphate isomerase
MNKTVGEALTLVRELRNTLGVLRDKIEIGVAPPFTALHPVAKVLEDSNILVAAQNSFWELSGAYTGEISPAMLRDVGCRYCIIGHSERRQYFGETDETVTRRVKAVLQAGLLPIVCIGETLAEREAGKTLEVVSRQLRGGLGGYSTQELAKFVIAYEPVWAIGTGKNANSAQAQEVHAYIRQVLAQLAGNEAANQVRIQYGGSVKPDNAAELLSQPDVDGALVGGASLKAADFGAIVKARV